MIYNLYVVNFWREGGHVQNTYTKNDSLIITKQKYILWSSLEFWNNYGQV